MPTCIFINTCLRTSLYSLLLGTALFGLFFWANDSLVGVLSAPIVLVIGVYNLKLLLLLAKRWYREKENRKQLWQTGLLMSLNIPVALLYAKMVLVLSNVLLVRLVNTAGQPLHNLVVLGCGEQRPLADLQPGQATILWLPISRACFERTVVVQYTAGKTTQRATIDGYVIEGQRINLPLGSSPQLTVITR